MKRFVGIAAIFVVIMAVSAPAMATIQTGNIFQLTWPNFSPHGYEGPFQMIPNGGNPIAVDNFYTFCVEQKEFFTPGLSYQIGQTTALGVISNGIGIKSVLTNRTLTGYSAWIYSMFRNDDGFNLPVAITGDGGITTTEYNALQYAVWAGMVKKDNGGSGIVGGTDAEQHVGDSNSYLGRGWTWDQLDALDISYSDFLASSWAGAGSNEAAKLAEVGNVQVLNLYGYNSTKKWYDCPAQDQLGIIPGQGQDHNVPEPAALIIWSLLSLSGGLWAWARRRGAESLGGARQPWSEETRAAILKIVSQN
jgi:hypothetical protein